GKPGEMKPTIIQLRADKNFCVQLPNDLQIQLAAVGASVLKTSTARELEDGVLPRFVYTNPSGDREIDAEGLRRIGIPEQLNYADHDDPINAQFGPVEGAFDFSITGAATEFQLNQIEPTVSVFDASTHSWLGSGVIADQSISNVLSVRECVLDKYHSGPVIVEVIYGASPATVDVPIKQGVNFSFGPIQGTLALASEGYWYADSDDVERAFDSGFTIGILLDHGVLSECLSCAAIDAQGNETPVFPDEEWGFSYPGYPVWFSGSVEEKPEFLRLRFWEEFYQLVFVAKFSVLGEENGSVDNLFDVRVPWIRVDRGLEFGTELESLTQVNFGDSTGVRIQPDVFFPDDYFPREFEDMSVRELLNEYRKYTNAERIYIEEIEPHLLRYPAHAEQTFSDRFTTWWDDLWSR
ncbi:MAG: hypothetical protein AAF585_09915, partial [Verrucomicrobiota bacterium]